MKFEEILKDFLNFKKIKVISWSNHEYIRIKMCGKIVNNIGNEYSFDQFSLSQSWVLYEEPLKELTLKEAVEITENGGTVYNHYNGIDVHYYINTRGDSVFKNKKLLNGEFKWEMASIYFSYKWYEVKA